MLSDVRTLLQLLVYAKRVLPLLSDLQEAGVQVTMVQQEAGDVVAGSGTVFHFGWSNATEEEVNAFEAAANAKADADATNAAAAPAAPSAAAASKTKQQTMQGRANLRTSTSSTRSAACQPSPANKLPEQESKGKAKKKPAAKKKAAANLRSKEFKGCHEAQVSSCCIRTQSDRAAPMCLSVAVSADGVADVLSVLLLSGDVWRIILALFGCAMAVWSNAWSC